MNQHSMKLSSNGVVTASSVIPVATMQVPSQLDSGNFSLDQLENTVSALISRLSEVCTDIPATDEINPMPVLVPIASRIAYMNSRIREIDRRLCNVLNALEI